MSLLLNLWVIVFKWKFILQVGNHFTICYHGRKVVLDPSRKLKKYPREIKKLWTGSSSEAKNLQENAWQYNSALVLASQKVQLAPPLSGVGPQNFKIHGQVYSRVDSLRPTPGVKPTYAQLYLLDTQQATDEQMGRDENRKCTRELFKKLDVVIRQNNPYVNSSKNMQRIDMEETALAAMENRPAKQTKMVFLQTSPDHRRYNEPVGDGVAAIFVGMKVRRPLLSILQCIRNLVNQRRFPISALTWIPWCTRFSFPVANKAGKLGWNTR